MPTIFSVAKEMFTYLNGPVPRYGTSLQATRHQFAVTIGRLRTDLRAALLHLHEVR